jgi:hypothetical protein
MAAVFVLVASVGAAAQGLEGERKAFFARSVERVEALAGWCQEHRLYLERDRLYEALLGLSPDHAEARRFLHYRKIKDGWERQKYSAPENRGRIEKRDLPAIEGGILFMSVVFVLVNLIADLLYAKADPRIAYD